MGRKPAMAAGTVNLMPGTCSGPAFRRIDVHLETG